MAGIQLSISSNVLLICALIHSTHWRACTQLFTLVCPILAKSTYSLYGLVFQTSFPGFVGVLFFLFFPFIASPFGFPMCGGNIDFQRKEPLCGERWGRRHMAQAEHLWISDAAVLLHRPWVPSTRVLRRKEYDTSTFQEPWSMRNRMNLLEESVKKSEHYIVLNQLP